MNDDLTFLATSHMPECTIRIDKHLVGYATIQLMTRGSVELSYDDRCYHLEGAWFWPAHPGPRIAFHAPAGGGSWHHRHVGFCGPRVSAWMASGLWPDGPQPVPTGRDFVTFFSELMGQSRRTDRWGRLRAINLLEQLLLELAEARAQSPRPEALWLPPVLEQLGRSDVFTPDYIGIAEGAGMALSTLRRRFRDATGTTMHEYVLQTRVSAARALLTETDISLKVVAERLGYESVYFFARQFRQIAGVPPGVYRRSRQ